MKKKAFLKQEHQATGLKCFLASMEDSHIKHLIELARDPSLIDLMGWNTSFAVNDTEKFIEGISNFALPYSRNSQPLLFGIYLNLEDLPIGYVVLKGLNRDLLTAEAGVAILDKKYQKKGYGRLALQRMITYAFRELHLKTIAAAILVSNQQSINLCKKLGFIVKETMYKSWTMPDGSLADMLWMEVNNKIKN
ncbi:MAG: GNAT family N-acetyltransferase [Cyanobacteriota bacterium]|nr:GNAT family N-acetyltransferase [Cyanobacteriota bacterium]